MVDSAKIMSLFQFLNHEENLKIWLQPVRRRQVAPAVQALACVRG